MTGRDDELFEAELRKLTPAPPPPELTARLASEMPTGFGLRQSSGAFGPRNPLPKRQRTGAVQDAAAPNRALPRPSWWRLFGWLAPAAAAAALIAALLLWRPSAPDGRLHVKPATASLKPAPKADEIEIDRRLVALFDAVAQLPSGEPVRFRCCEWADEVVVRDPARGIVIERRTPRLEVVPLRFETY